MSKADFRFIKDTKYVYIKSIAAHKSVESVSMWKFISQNQNENKTCFPRI